MAKIKEPQRGLGYTLRLRNMLAKRNIALKMT
jgi:hypothetical protein